MTFVELMIVITILGIVANIAIPKVRDARRRATAANVIGDFVVVRAAAFDRYAAVGGYPSSSNWGEVPSMLLGLQIKSQDRRLMESIKGLYGGPLAFGSATQVTLVIE
jgi:prepilin-type N-terminal cleavage/methylation domain-containing protein